MAHQDEFLFQRFQEGCHVDAPIVLLAPFGETLENADTSSRYVSPDKVCDTSTALYPDSTWLTRGAPHVSGSYGTDYADFIIWLLSTDNLKVTANPDYPAFMKSAKDQHLEKWG